MNVATAAKTSKMILKIKSNATQHNFSKHSASVAALLL